MSGLTKNDLDLLCHYMTILGSSGLLNKSTVKEVKNVIKKTQKDAIS